MHIYFLLTGLQVGWTLLGKNGLSWAGVSCSVPWSVYSGTGIEKQPLFRACCVRPRDNVKRVRRGTYVVPPEASL